MSDERSLYDPGLQPERTELAWRRTALALGVGSLLAARILPEVLGSILWVLPGLVGVVFAAVLWGFARRRYLAWTASLIERRRLPGAGLLVALVAFTVTAGLVMLVASVIIVVR